MTRLRANQPLVQFKAFAIYSAVHMVKKTAAYNNERKSHCVLIVKFRGSWNEELQARKKVQIGHTEKSVMRMLVCHKVTQAVVTFPIAQ